MAKRKLLIAKEHNISTNKQAYKKAIVKELSCNYKTVFKRYGYNSLDPIEYEKLYRFLKPAYT